MKKILAFTLAEVLITISVLGVIAALTIPNLYQQKKRKEYSAKLKHFYSKMENAIEQSAMETPLKYLTCPVYNATTSNSTLRTDAMLDWYLDYIDPYVGHVSIKTVPGAYYFNYFSVGLVSNVASAPHHHKIYFDDGSMLVLIPTGCNCPQWIYDITGDAGPNRVPIDVHLFQFCFTDDLRRNRFGDSNVYFGNYVGSGNAGTNSGNTVGLDREVIKARCAGEHRTGGEGSCGKLLQIDGWEFKPDFPIKF